MPHVHSQRRALIARRCALFITAMIAAAGTSHAQEVISVGKGSYASSPPATAGAGPLQMVTRTFPLVVHDDRPIPTNKFWTSLLDGQPKGSLWTYPWRVDPTPTGLNLFLPTHWSNGGNDLVADAPLRLDGAALNTHTLLVKDWSDWLLSFRLKQSETQFLDVTIGEGMPCVWIESAGIPLILTPGDRATFTDSAGHAIQFPFKGTKLVITDQAGGGRTYGVFLPPGATVTRAGAQLHIQSPGKSFLTLAAMHAPQDLPAFARVAYSIPRKTQMDYTYDPAKGKVTTTWTVTTEPLVPGAPDIALQGFLPHHYRDAAQSLPFNGPTYITPRGPMKSSFGNHFQLVYDFAGFLPILPAPSQNFPGDTFDPARMAFYLDRAAKITTYGNDTYWGGKDLIRFSQNMLMAKQLHDDPAYAALKKSAETALADWCTFTPGEKAHYFTRYPNWHALIGIADSYDSGRFNDQHFHLGYFTHAAALLAMEDPDFLHNYGDMLRLIAKQYANYDRSDKNFPYFRTFDIWAGHSWAGGLGSPGGNNQESSSEAMQSWIGLYLLGTMLDDKNMTAAGAMGYAMESRAALDYWLNIQGDLLPPQYKHPIVGVLWSGGDVFGTYFSGDPAWVYGIQTLPQSPGMEYLDRDPAWAKRLYTTMLALQKAKTGNDELPKMNDLGNVLLSQEALVDPPAAVAAFDRFWTAKEDIVITHANAPIGYYQAHAYNQLGQRQWDIHLSVPTSAVYHHAASNTASYIVYNPKPYPVLVTAAKGDAVLGGFLAKSRELTRVTSLQPMPAKSGVAASYPADGDSNVPRRIATLYLVFTEPVDASSLAGIRLDGPSPAQLTFATEDAGRVVACKLAGALTPAGTYRLVIPATIQLRGGGPALDTERTLTFTLEKQPPLALEASTPEDGAAKIPVTLPAITLAFNAPLDPATLSRIRLEGPHAPILHPQLGPDHAHVTLTLVGPLEVDQAYSVILPTTLATAAGDRLARESRITFTTPPAACPPNVYADSFAGGGIGKDDSITIDLHNAEHPHTGKFAIKITAGAKDGAVYFFNGTSDHDAGRSPIDLSAYAAIEFYLRGDAPPPAFVWAKIGHPVFDKAFNQARLEGITSTYKRFTLAIPSPKTSINTLLSIGVPAGKTVYLDDIRFIKQSPSP